MLLHEENMCLLAKFCSGTNLIVFFVDNVRAHELRKLRQIYLSEITLNLYEVYFQSRDVIPAHLEKSVEIANLVAAERDEETPLHKELQDNGRLQELLANIRVSSLELISLGRTPFAY
jgi:hypothetical protein